MSDELTFEERHALDAWLPIAPPADFADRVLAARRHAPARPRRRWIAASVAGALAAAAVVVVVATRPGGDEPTAAPTARPAYAPPPAPPARRPLPPTTADVRLSAGEGGTIHDPNGHVSIEIEYAGQCPSGGSVVVSPGNRQSALPAVGGRDSVTIDLDAGAWAYAVTCEGATSPLHEADITVVRDDGTRALAGRDATRSLEPDGRNYRIAYQRSIPSLRVRAKRLWVSRGTDVQTYEAAGSEVVVPAFTLREGTYSLRTDDAPGAAVTSVVIERDWTTPQVQLRSPRVDEPWRGELFVEGSVLPGWHPSVDGADVPVDSDGTFLGRLLIRPGAKVLVVRVVHYGRGIQLYVRRPGR